MTDDLSAAREAWEKVRVRAFGNTEPCEEGSCRHVDCRLLLTGGNLFAVLEDTLAQRNEMLAKVREAVSLYLVQLDRWHEFARQHPPGTMPPKPAAYESALRQLQFAIIDAGGDDD